VAGLRSGCIDPMGPEQASGIEWDSATADRSKRTPKSAAVPRFEIQTDPTT